MIFTIPICLEDLGSYHVSGSKTDILDKIYSLGDSGLLDNAKELEYMPGFYLKRITNRISILFFLREGEPVIVRIKPRSFLYQIAMRKRDIGLDEDQMLERDL